jgi:two-component system CheB/CheR fusion protein
MSITNLETELDPLQSDPALIITAEDPLPEIYMNIVAIGASAGGLEALQRWFDNIPNDTNAAFVVIQHLSPDYKSIMDKLLEKHTTMPISVVEAPTLLEKNNIYLMSPGKEMSLEGDRIVPVARSNNTRLHLPINYFFKSIATNVNFKSIAVILSGTGSDGCLGVKAIHEGGGLVVVQSPDDSQFNGMPVNAIATGVVDLTATIEELALTVTNFLKKPGISDGAITNNIDDSRRSLQEICRLLLDETGIDFSVYKLSTFSRRLENRMNISQISSLNEYIALLKDKRAGELKRLQQDLFIGVTEFFRDGEAYAALTKQVLEKLIREKSEQDSIRIWSIGCSTGEEAYSTAMICHDIMEELGKQMDIKIFATDADMRALNKAMQGLYSESISTEIHEPLLSNHFVKETSSSYRIRKHIRNMVVFAKHDILKDPPFSNIDLVTCRNLLIYFQPLGQQKAFNAIRFSLNQGGYLFLGKAESPAQADNVYEVIDYSAKLYKKVNGANDRVTPVVQNESYDFAKKVKRIDHNQGYVQVSPSSNKSILLAAIAELLFDRYLSATIIVDKEFEIIHSYGNVSEWMLPHKPGRTQNNVEDLFSPSIASYMVSAIKQSTSTKKEVVYDHLEDKETGKQEYFIRAIPYYHYEKPNSDADILHIMSLGSTVSENPDEQDQAEARSIKLLPNEATQKRLEYLEDEVKNLRTRLKTSQVQLNNASEQLQTSNEELMASNEELQGTNEELQAVNEELYTLNSEYQQKINELTVATNDIDNFMKSTGIAAIFLDKAYRIRRYTAPFSDYINILPVDVNRSFLDLNLSFGFGNIEKYLEECALTGVSHTRRINLSKNHEGLFKVLPYMNSNRQIDGVVLMIDEISENLKSIDD